MPETETAMEAEILAAEARLRAAMLAGDVAALDALIDDELAFVGPDGTVFTKAMDLGMHRDGAIRIHRLDPSERLVRPIAPDVVVVMVRMDASATIGGDRHDDVLRYTRVWRKRDTHWRVVAGGIVVVQPAAPTP